MQDYIEKYGLYLMLEQGLSENTRAAYLHDVQTYLSFLSDEGIDPLCAKLDDFHRFTLALYDIGITPRSICRVLSGVRSFYRFLLVDGYIETDPTALLESPKKSVHLPEVLTLEEVDAIIAAIDLSQPFGQRDRAMIEVLYSCGLRVSELCNLQMPNLFLEEGFLRVMGKGSKERLVPVSPRAAEECGCGLSTALPSRPSRARRTLCLSASGGAAAFRASRCSTTCASMPPLRASPRPSAPTPCATPLPRTSCKAGQTFVPFRRCWDTRAS